MREELEARFVSVLFLGCVLGVASHSYPLIWLALLAMAIWLRPLRCRVVLVGAALVGVVIVPASISPLTATIPIHDVGTVSTMPSFRPDGQVFEVAVQGINLLATIPSTYEVSIGDGIALDGIAKPVERDYRIDPVQGVIRLEKTRIVSHGLPIYHWALRWRRSFQTFVESNLDPKDAAIADGICFSGRGMLDSESKQRLASSGLVHLFSVSGMQVFVLAMLLNLALRPFPIHRSAQIGILAFVLVLYALATGLQPQIIRAIFMTLAGLSAYSFHRDPDALSALSLAGVLCLLWNPNALFGMSFQLSFATLVMVSLFYRPDRRNAEDLWDEFCRGSKNMMRLSGVVLAAVTPFIAYYLGVISLLSIPSNLLVGWTIPLLLGGAFTSHAISFIFPELGGQIVIHFVGPICGWIRTTSQVMDVSWGTLTVPGFHPVWILIYFGILTMMFRRRIVQP